MATNEEIVAKQGLPAIDRHPHPLVHEPEEDKIRGSLLR
jgi:hypothetical protein